MYTSTCSIFVLLYYSTLFNLILYMYIKIFVIKRNLNRSSINKTLEKTTHKTLFHKICIFLENIQIFQDSIFTLYIKF